MRYSDVDQLTKIVIGLAIKVHKSLGPGLLESVYQAALEYELKKNNIPHEREKEIAVPYEDITLDVGFRCDFLVDESLIVECKSVKKLDPVDQAQTITYATHAGAKTALLVNFNVLLLRDGIKRLFPRTVNKG